MDARSYDVLSGVVVAVGFFEGVLPFLAKLVFDSTPILSLPARLPAPAWWIVSVIVIATAFGLLIAIDNAKTRAHPDG